MKTVMTIIGALTLVAGILLFIMAFTTPTKYPIATASAIQISQVYAEATFYAVLAIAAFVFSGVLLYATNISD